MEIFLVLFLLSGQLKAFMQFFGLHLPVDITLLAAVIVVGMTVYKVVKKNSFITHRVSFLGIGLLLVFYSWMIFSLFYSASEQYSMNKTFLFLLNIVAFSSPFFFKDFNIRRFIRTFTVGAIVLALGLLPFQYFDLLGSASQPGAEGSYSAIGGLYLSLSEYLGLILVLMLTKKDEMVFSKKYDVLVVMVVLGLMVLLGARGPILFAVIVYVLYYLISIRIIRLTFKTKVLWWTAAGVIMILLLIFAMTRFPATNTLLQHSVNRFISLLGGAVEGGNPDHSTQVRLGFMQQAIDGIFKDISSFLCGYGIGSFGIMTRGLDVRQYPHNLILEVWFELGLIGLSLLFAWIISILNNLRQVPTRFISYAVLLYIFLNLMKSSSLVDIRTEFAIFALFAVQNFISVRAPKPVPA